MNNETPTTLTFDDKRYQIADLSENARLIVATLAENEGLQIHHQTSLKHLQIAHQALRSNLEMAVDGVAYEEVQAEPTSVDLS